MKNQWVARSLTVILGLLHCGVISNKHLVAQESNNPGFQVFEELLKKNKILLFGEVSKVSEKKSSSEDLGLKGFQFFQVSINTDKILSKDKYVLKNTYQFEFGTMIDQKNIQTTMPVKEGEKIVLVLDSYIPGKVHILKDNLLQIYEHKKDENYGTDYFISKMAKNYSQKKLKISDLYYLASDYGLLFEGVLDVNHNNQGISRGLASLNDVKLNNLSSSYSSTPHAKRNPNSSTRMNSEEELSVFSLLLVLVLLGTFSHFVIKYYEDSQEEV